MFLVPECLFVCLPQPQHIAIFSKDALMIDVQTCGGFYHRGLIVDPSDEHVSMDEVGMNWLRGELAPGVFEYRELGDIRWPIVSFPSGIE